MKPGVTGYNPTDDRGSESGGLLARLFHDSNCHWSPPHVMSSRATALLVKFEIAFASLIPSLAGVPGVFGDLTPGDSIAGTEMESWKRGIGRRC